MFNLFYCNTCKTTEVELCDNRFNKMSWSMLSNAAERSSKVNIARSESKADKMSVSTLSDSGPLSQRSRVDWTGYKQSFSFKL